MLVLHLCLGWKHDFRNVPQCMKVLAEIQSLKDGDTLGCHITGNILIPTDKGQFVCVYS